MRKCIDGFGSCLIKFINTPSTLVTCFTFLSLSISVYTGSRLYRLSPLQGATPNLLQLLRQRLDMVLSASVTKYITTSSLVTKYFLVPFLLSFLLWWSRGFTASYPHKALPQTSYNSRDRG